MFYFYFLEPVGRRKAKPNLISDILKLTKARQNQAYGGPIPPNDDPRVGIDDDIILENDPMQIIKDEIRSSQPQSVSYTI